MSGPWEQYQNQPTTEEAPATEAPPAEMAQPAQSSQSSAPAETEEGPWTRYAAPAPVDSNKAETPLAEDAGKTWAEEHPIAGRVLSAIHGAGELVPGREKLSAGLHAITDFGQGSFEEKYERAKRAQERAGKVLSEAYPGAHLAGELAPMLTPVGAETMLAGEGLVGKGIGKALPFLGETGRKVAGVSGFGGLYGAAQGAAEGDTSEERIKNAISGGTLGAALGPVGMGIGATAKSVLGPMGKTATQEAAERLGPEISKIAPRYVTSEAPTQRMAAAGVRAIPFVGEKITEAAKRLNEGLGEKLLSVAQTSRPTPELAGEKIKAGINKWIGEDSKQYVSSLYNDVQKTFDDFNRSNGFPAGARASHPLSATTKVFDELAQSNIEKARPEVTNAMKLVQEALSRPEGLTFNGIQGLRQDLGDLLGSHPELIAKDVKGAELKRLWGGLSEDLKSAALNEGGAGALHSFNKAEREYKIINAKRNLLKKISGVGDRYSGEQVFSNLANMAMGNRGDLRRLELAKNTLSRNDWNEVVSNMVHRIGVQDSEAGKPFSPAKFLTAYSKMSDGAKNLLFGAKGSGYRQNIDDIALMARGIGEGNEHLNTSKTAHVNEFLKTLTKLGALGGIGTIGVNQAQEGEYGTIGAELAGTYGGGMLLASLLTSPRGSFAIKEWMKKGSPAAGKALTDEISRIMGATPKAAQYATQTNLTKNMTNREGRASGGKVGTRDYPAKRLNKMERAARRAQQAIAIETTKLMEKPDEQIAQALRIAKGE